MSDCEDILKLIAVRALSIYQSHLVKFKIKKTKTRIKLFIKLKNIKQEKI